MRLALLTGIIQDLRYAVRGLKNSPVFTAAVVLTLALGIGANVAIFSTFDTIVLRPLPYYEPDRIAMIWEDATAAGFPRNTPAPGNYTEWKRLNRTFDGMAASRPAVASLTADGPPEQVLGRRVSPSFFSVLGVGPLLGRTFTEDEDRHNASVVVISHSLWQRRYGGDETILAKTLLMNDRRYQVIGVMPPGFVFRNREIEYWLPIQFTPAEALERRSHYLQVVGRMKRGVTVEAAQADMKRVSEELQRTFPDTNARITTVVVPLKEDVVGDSRLELQVLMGAVGVLLLIGCANLANLLLSRAAVRRTEFAVRAALGATRGRLVRQTIIEAIVMSWCGGLVGLAIAQLGLSFMADLVPVGFASAPASILDLRLIVFSLAVSIAAALVFSITPAIQSARTSLQTYYTRSVVGGDGRFTRDLLVVFQVAAALALLVGAGLLLRTLANFRAIELGFNPENVMTLRTSLPQTRYPEPSDRLTFYDRVVSAVRTLPGVESAAYGSTLPFTSIGNTTWFQLEGITLDPNDPADALRRVGTPDYLKTIGARLIEGRLFNDGDVGEAPRVVVINETMARKYWPRTTPVGHRVRFGPSEPFSTIVGVVQDVRERGYELEMKPAIYLSVAQRPAVSIEYLVVRVTRDPMNIVRAIRQEIARIDRDQPIATVRTLDEIVDLDIADRHQQMSLLVGFAGLALFLAAIGLYGVLSYAVVRRRRELALRLALGASPASVMNMVIGRGLALIAVGCVAGLTVAWAGTRAMQALLYGVSPSDPATTLGVLTLVGAVAVIAIVFPAVRAARVDPVVALRYE